MRAGGGDRRSAVDRLGDAWPPLGGVLLMTAGLLAACSSSSSPTAGTSGGAVLLVGTFHGHTGKYKTIQSAVDAAKPGDWILIAPGDYHENADESGVSTDPSHGDMGGVMITTSNIHLRGHEPLHGHRGRHQVRRSGCLQRRPDRPELRGHRAATARRSAATGSWCGRPTTSRWTISPHATSWPARVTRATRSGGTGAPTAARSACTATRAAT